MIDALISVRKAKKVTKAELARRIGTTEATVARMESKAGSPRLDTYIKAALSLGCTIELKH